MDLISREAVLKLFAIYDSDYLYEAISDMPAAQLEKETCKDCKWEYAFGYGECHHCRRHFNDMWEMNDNG